MSNIERDRKIRAMFLPIGVAVSLEEMQQKAVVEHSHPLPSPEPPPAAPPLTVPRALLEEAYGLPVRPRCRCPGQERECMATICEPGPDSLHGSSLMLLPGEEDVIRDRLKQKGIEWLFQREPPLVVGMGDVCPYHTENQTCAIYDDRPWVCRSYPLRAHAKSRGSLAILTAQGCPSSINNPNKAKKDDHYNAWIAAWETVTKFIPPQWWKRFAAMCPAGFLTLFYLVSDEDVAQGSVPLVQLARMADPECGLCEGRGVVYLAAKNNETEACSCIPQTKIKQMLRNLAAPQRKFKPKWGKNKRTRR